MNQPWTERFLGDLLLRLIMLCAVGAAMLAFSLGQIWAMGIAVAALAVQALVRGDPCRALSGQVLVLGLVLFPPWQVILPIAALAPLESLVSVWLLQRNEKAWIVALVKQVETGVGPSSALFQALKNLKDSETEAAHLALTDPLTGLPGRWEFERRLREHLSQTKRKNLSLTLTILDCIDLGGTNRREGRMAGDERLKALAKNLNGFLAFRIGGDEFAVIHINVPTDAVNFQHLSQVHIGQAISQSADTPMDLLARADAALRRQV